MRIKFFLLLIFTILYYSLLLYLRNIDLVLPESTAQIVSFPFFILIFYYIFHEFNLLKTWHIVFIIFFGFLFSGFGFYNFTNEKLTIYFAPLKQDALAKKSTIIKSEFDKNLSKNNFLTTTTVYKKIDNLEDAQAFIKQQRSAKALVWGDDKNIRITFSNTLSTYTIQQVGKQKWHKTIPDFKIIDNIQGISAGFSPIEPTVKILASIFSSNLLDKYQALKIKAKWRTKTPKAYIYFQLGNKYLEDFFKAPAYQYPELDCAINNYKIILQSIIGKDSPELKRAVMNNLGVALLVRGIIEDYAGDIQKGRKFLLISSWVKNKKKSKLQTPIVAEHNLREVGRYWRDKKRNNSTTT